jgi:hypothetical protein
MKLAAMISGGRSSAMAVYSLINNPKYKNYEKVFIFNNTGLERPETIEFLKDIQIYFNINIVCLEAKSNLNYKKGIEAVVVNIDNLNMRGKPFVEAIKQMNKNKNIGVPNSAIPYCSDYAKTRPALYYIRNVLKWKKKEYLYMLGFRGDDIPKRITMSELKYNTRLICPLLTDFDKIIYQKDVYQFFFNIGFDLKIDSKLGNCELCYKKSFKTLEKSIQHKVRNKRLLILLEHYYGNYFFRENTSTETLFKISNINKPLSFFDSFEESCACSYSVFN